MFQAKVVEKSKYTFFCSGTSSPENYAVCEKKKNCTARQATGDSTAHVHSMLYI